MPTTVKPHSKKKLNVKKSTVMVYTALQSEAGNIATSKTDPNCPTATLTTVSTISG
jgi:hypothetical protein